MSWIRSRGRRTARRLAVVDGYRFTAGVRHRFTLEHGDLDTAAVALVQSAARQWFRLAARHPAAHPAMPSVVVDDLWREMVRDARDYAEFCDAAFGRLLPRPPEPGSDRPARLATTFRLAREDENGALPLLFRIDRELRVPGGGHYLADCGGGRDVCHEMPGATCLKHITGVKGARRWPSRFESTSIPPGTGGFGP
ncbi:hypothetical protein ODJ79_32645 [Actinoplanes sp. KI2]|uniref:hypothetical protein n=1 Tax=Actinoplanes sp. KI2 TaxID=2983315 RepID=UPI0021D58A82|nr:hypothetical protein [Actinoplanes sp. KI2]MCU7728485.1 hypothetical protein [Actinoplanes sp. KI2]